MSDPEPVRRHCHWRRQGRQDAGDVPGQAQLKDSPD